MIFLLAGIVLLLYSLLLLRFRAGWHALTIFNPAETIHHPYLSIVIATRNEEENLAILLEGLAMQDYPANRFEIIVSDDHSTDQTLTLAKQYKKQFNRLIILSGEPGCQGKKAALSAGIKIAGASLIITLDADVLIKKEFLTTLAQYSFQNTNDMIILPLMVSPDSTFRGIFESLEQLCLTTIAGGSAAMGNPILCNGAALAFTKQNYIDFHPANHYASGDDIFFMLNLKKKKNHTIRFLKSPHVIATTATAPTFRFFLMQRLRWLSKSAGYTDPLILYTAIIVLLANLSIPSLLFIHQGWIGSALLLVYKTIVDYSLVAKPAGFFGMKKTLRWFIPAAIIYPLYVVIICIALLFVKPTWKARRII